jgi:site-specific DNA-methyltransferase (adenine-specific)
MPILDISTVEGEIAYAIQRKYGDRLNSRLYSIPSSPLAYELTRKIYGLLDMPIENVLDFYSYELISDNNEEYLRRLNTINPEIVIGVPPFSESAGGGRGDGGSAIYHKFFNFVKDNLSARYIDMMMQSTWYTGGRGDDLDAFRDYMLDDSIGNRHVREFHDYPNVETYIKGVTTLRGGICLFLWDREYDGDCLFINRFNHRDYPLNRPLRYTHGDYRADFLIRWNEGLSILEKVLNRETSFIYEEDSNLMHRRNPFGFPNTKDNLSSRKTARSNTKVYLAKGKVGYAKDEQYSHTPEKDALRDRWKVMVAKSSSGGDDLPHLVISEPIVSEPGSVTANTHYIIDGVPTETEARNLAAYMRTRFFRFMVNLLRSNQNMRVDMYQFVPRLDFTRNWTDGDLYDRYELSPEEREFISLVVRDMDSK